MKTRVIVLCFYALIFSMSCRPEPKALRYRVSDDKPGPTTPSPPSDDNGPIEVQPIDVPGGTGQPNPISSGTDDPNALSLSIPREMRAVWIATVENIDWPSKTGLSKEAQQIEMATLLDKVAATGFNTVIFQVRTEADALYKSSLEPWSRVFNGTQGTDPGYDPLQWTVDAARARGLQIHVWLNPFRAARNRTLARSPKHVSQTHGDAVVTYGDQLWMDPGSSQLRQQTLDVVKDLVTRYSLDGLHFDDYFYPYPQPGLSFNDNTTYQAYRNNGGSLPIDAWRRENVNRMIQSVGEIVKQHAPHMLYGISPFGIYRPGTPAGVTGLDQYAQLYADPKRWVEAKWVDYLAPQLYWPTSSSGQPFKPLLTWWSSLSNDRYTFVGHALHRLSTSSPWDKGEFDKQITIVREHASNGVLGSMFFSAKYIRDDHLGIATHLKNTAYNTLAWPPRHPRIPDGSIVTPSLLVEGTTIRWNTTLLQETRALAIFQHGLGGWSLTRFVPPELEKLSVTPGRYAVATIDLYGRHSQAIELTVE